MCVHGGNPFGLRRRWRDLERRWLCPPTFMLPRRSGGENPQRGRVRVHADQDLSHQYVRTGRVAGGRGLGIRECTRIGPERASSVSHRGSGLWWEFMHDPYCATVMMRYGDDAQ